MATDRIPAPSLDPDDPPKPTVSRGARACTVCRAAKMKCVGAEEDGAKPCQRCKRSNAECIFEKHRRGRKPGSKLSEASKMLRKLERGVSSQKAKGHEPLDQCPLPATQIPFPVSDSRSAPPDPAFHAQYSPRDVYVPSNGPRHSPDGTPSNSSTPALSPPRGSGTFPALTAPFPPSRYTLPQPQTQQQQQQQQQQHHGHQQHNQHRPPPPSSSHHSMESTADDDDDDDDKDDGDNMYPAKMLEREGRRQSFFGIVLTNPGDSDKHPTKSNSPTHVSVHLPPPPPRPSLHDATISIPRLPSASLDDPVSAGLILEADISVLFEMVYVRLNSFINLFDPALHTPSYVRSRCPFLFTTLLMVGCKFWKPDRFRACQRLAEDFCLRAFQEGWKRVEVVQAFMCMTYWKEPDDNRTWTYIGYACRMAVELGLNTYNPSTPVGETPVARLERRNRERTYLVLFVHDRSLAMQTGRQWMLPEDDFVRHSEHWHRDSTLLPIDVVVSAQVQLRRIAAEVIDVFYLQKGGHAYSYGGVGGTTSQADVNYEILLRGCNNKLQLWEGHWLDAIRKGRGESFHFGLLVFFKLHVRLFLNSFGLQSSFMTRTMAQTGGVSMSASTTSLPALSVCFTSAVDTLRVVTKDFANVDMLRYAQDSINVMTAYSAVFLLKLLRNTIAGRELGEGAQEQVYELIVAAADAYQESAQLMSLSSLKYHSRFLRTLVAKDRALKQRQVERERKAIEGQQQQQQQQPQQGQGLQQRQHQRSNGVVHHPSGANAGAAMTQDVQDASVMMYARTGAPNGTMAVEGGDPGTGAGVNGAIAGSGGSGGGAGDGGPVAGRPTVVTTGLYQPRGPTSAGGPRGQPGNMPPTNTTSTVTNAATASSSSVSAAGTTAVSGGQGTVVAPPYVNPHGWNFPISPRLSAHPLGSTGGELAMELQAAGMHLGVGGTNGSAGGTNGGGEGGEAYTLEQLGDARKMEEAYWYNMHAEMGYVRGVSPPPPIYVSMPYRTLDHQHQHQQVYGQSTG